MATLWFGYSGRSGKAEFLSGQSISLIDEFQLEFIKKGPPEILLRTIPNEPLSDWEHVTSSRSHTIWKTFTKHPIAAEPQLRNGNTTVQFSENVFLSETPVNRWDWFGNQVWIKTLDKDQPQNNAYSIRYVASKIPSPKRFVQEDLANPFHYGYIHNQSGETFRLSLFGLKNQLFLHDPAGGSNVTVQIADQALPYIPPVSIPRQVNERIIYPSRNQNDVPQLHLSASNMKFHERIRFSKGDYALALFAKSTEKNNGEFPRIRVKINGVETALSAIQSEDHQLYLYPFRSERNALRVDISLAADSKSSRGVLIRSIQVWPAKRPQADVQNSWTFMNRNELQLHRFEFSGPYALRSSRPTFAKELYLPPGMALIEMKAAASSNDRKERRKVAIYLDEKLIAGVQVKKGPENYSFPLPIRGGMHKVKIIFQKEDDGGENGIVELSNVKVRYLDSVLIFEKLQTSIQKTDQRYLVKYPVSITRNPAEQFYNDQTSQTAQNGYRIGPVSSYVDDQTEVRRALVLPGESEITYPMNIRKDAQLLFATRVVSHSSEKATCKLHLEVRAGRFLGLTRKLFSADFALSKKDGWMDHSIDLATLAGQNWRFTFKTEFSPPDGSCKMAIQIGNPRMIVRHKNPTPLQHIVMVTFDSLRADHLSLYGYKRKTSSAIDAFAHDGIRFKNVITQAPWTLPSFGSVFTALYPSFHQVGNRNSILLGESFTLTNALKARGYYNIAITNNPYLNPRFQFFKDFDQYHYGPKNREQHNQLVLKSIEDFKSQKLFLFAHFIDPHIPYSPAANHEGKFHDTLPLDRKKIYLSALQAKDTCQVLRPSEVQSLVDCYDEEILSVDDQMQQLITQMKRLRIYDNSLIIFGSDHGEEFQAHGTFFHGRSLYNDVLKVPLIIKLPESYPKTKTEIDETVRMIDLMPTLLDLIKVSAPPYINGTTLVPLWNGGKFKKPEVIVSESSVSGQISLISGKYKYISNARKPNCALWVKEELYDMHEDPEERNNVTEQFPAVLEFFRAQKLHFEQSAGRFVRQRRSNNFLNVTEMDEATKRQLEALGYLQ